MEINKNKAIEAFHSYVNKYNSKDIKIKLKIEHTERVYKICELIAEDLKLSNNDKDIAFLIGLLHDIGRFEQIKRYKTFNDAASIDHAKLGVKILFEDNLIRNFISDTSEDELIKKAILYHNAYKIPENLDDRTTMFCNLLRDADKIDIFKVNTIIPLEEIYNVTKEQILNADITEAVYESILNKDTILRSIKKTPADNIIGHISLVFGLVYDASLKITKEQGCLEKLMDFKFINEESNCKLNKIKKFVNEYINERLK